MRRLAAALAAAVALCTQAAPPALPNAVRGDARGLKPLGEARLRVLLWHVYDAALWSDDYRWSPDTTFALDLRYGMEVKGADITARSLEEMRKLGFTDKARLARWEQAMGRIFPDIRAGDRLVGLSVAGRETRFYGEGGLIGVVPDAEFTRAFFAIWLDERTSEPAMRRRLLQLDP